MYGAGTAIVTTIVPQVAAPKHVYGQAPRRHLQHWAPRVRRYGFKTCHLQSREIPRLRENKEDSRGRGLAKLKQRATQQVPAARRSVVSGDTAATEKE